MKKFIFLLVSVLFAHITHAQCQQHVLSTVPATQFSTWQYIDCETGELETQSLPCCGWTLPMCAIVGSVELISGDGFSAVLINEVGPPWESCIPYNEPDCPYDLNGDGFVSVVDLLTFLSYDQPGVGELAGLLTMYGEGCE